MPRGKGGAVLATNDKITDKKKGSWQEVLLSGNYLTAEDIKQAGLNRHF